jgi:hypothetical protein
MPVAMAFEVAWQMRRESGFMLRSPVAWLAMRALVSGRGSVSHALVGVRHHGQPLEAEANMPRAVFELEPASPLRYFAADVVHAEGEVVLDLPRVQLRPQPGHHLLGQRDL